MTDHGSSSTRRIAHLDMDAFFVSIELLRYPQLRGQPVVVGGTRAYEPTQQSDGHFTFFKLSDYKGRGVVTTSTYEARALGVFSGMSLMRCATLAPHIILLPSHFDIYRDYSRRFKEAVRASESLTFLCERVSNDLKQKNYACRTIGIKLRYQNFQTITRDITLPHFIHSSLEIREAARACLKRVPWDQKIRLLGIRASGLKLIHQIPSSLKMQLTLPL